ncbi:MAG: hypothetical protein HC906_05930 [Bacteroidales bacterium]|nr:hypothetical protein [Bacteroidales bacterium]
MIRITTLFFLVFVFPYQSFCTNFRLVQLRVDNLIFDSDRHSIDQNGDKQIYFVYNNEDEVCEVRLFPDNHTPISRLNLMGSADFDLVDSLVNINNEYYQFKVKFRNLTKSQFLKFTLLVQSDTNSLVNEIKLFPCTKTNVGLNPSNDELYIGEEKEFELITNNIDNIRYSTEWTKGNDIDYRIVEKNGRLIAYLLPNTFGNRKVEIKLQSNKPQVNDKGELQYDLDPVIFSFSVKNSRLQFITIDKKEVTLDEESRMEGILVQMDNSRLLTMNKTYRIENREEPGGPLIAELYTKNSLTNNRVMCILRVYNYHRNSDGYLFIKDGDEARFITNFSITPKTKIEKISILREGDEWVQNLSVHPGEKIDVKIQGEGLHKARFHFDDVEEMSTDTLIRNENEQFFKIKIPLNINKKLITIYMDTRPSGYSLNVREFQEPRPFDYIMVNYGDMSRTVSNIKGPVLYSKTVKDVVFSFNNDRIDSPDELYGKQYLKFNVEISGMKNELIEMRTIDNIVVCPSARSPRYENYEMRDCTTDEVSLNKVIRKSTHDLDEWSRIKVTVQNDQAKYGGEGMKKDMEIILKKTYKFDIDVSFPAGLITVYKTDVKDENTGITTRETEFGNLWGVSMAMIAQFSFYHPDKIAKLRPYKVGAGFIALNAFNLTSEDSDQDLAFVVLGSLYPTSKDNRLSFPLYIGGGYKLLDRSWMFLFGPGIRVRL